MKALAALLLALAVAGCGRDHEPDLPEACTSSPSEFAAALRAAPQPVQVDGVPISDCLAPDSSVGDVQAVGFALLGAAQRLGEERDAVALGYLVGALRRASGGAQGIHGELVRRIEQEAAALRGSAGFERGVRAGRSSG